MATLTRIQYTCDAPGCGAVIEADDPAEFTWDLSRPGEPTVKVHLCPEHASPLVAIHSANRVGRTKKHRGRSAQKAAPAAVPARTSVTAPVVPPATAVIPALAAVLGEGDGTAALENTNEVTP